MNLPLLSADRDGTGEPLLLIHGIGSTRQDFAALLPLLAADYDVVSVDLPGHGDSPTLAGALTVPALADALEADLDARGLDKVHVLGNSLGGRLALELAARGRALSVVALSPSGLAAPFERVQLGATMATARFLMKSLRPWIGELSTSPTGRAALLSGFRARPWGASQAEALAVRGGFADARDFWSMLLWSIIVDVPTGLDRIRCPVILAQGSFDLIGACQTPRYLPFVPGARFEFLLGAGHAPQSDSPDALIRLVREAVHAAVPDGASSAPRAA